ncbi:zinc ribbon domain-containing protein [Haloechinothrix sp. LS1_15]|uniref:FmdB family zinc ribbon protein n=1 Tax=Haloechinothrix sp. LS1_15 TaxID=2652248 RepID=UPI002944BC13|nr:zinc ribbon domain-containing protein [Haloechinothrix sp. LS1_15]MDV6012427.1 zinc ribbon domain-containing protein [Haloechinothrix sp. LS1_15]
MPSYEYRCRSCGPLERVHAMGAAPTTEPCPGCDGHARRAFSPPRLNRVSREVSAARECAAESSERPRVTRRDTDPRPDPAPARPELVKLVGKQAAQRLRQAPHPADPGR